jgi:STAS-like domain of unknown function (DUF4325)
MKRQKSNIKSNKKSGRKPKQLVLGLQEYLGDFAEDKDWAATFREQAIRSTLNEGNNVVLDFTGISLTTQSFVHALISDVLRSEGESVLDRLEFRGCTPSVKGIIETVVQYSLETQEDDERRDDRLKDSLEEGPKATKLKKLGRSQTS